MASDSVRQGILGPSESLDRWPEEDKINSSTRHSPGEVFWGGREASFNFSFIYIVKHLRDTKYTNL